MSLFIKKKENPLIVLTTDLDFENDYRVKYLKTLGDFEIFRDKDHEFIEYEKRAIKDANRKEKETASEPPK